MVRSPFVRDRFDSKPLRNSLTAGCETTPNNGPYLSLNKEVAILLIASDNSALASSRVGSVLNPLTVPILIFSDLALK